MSICWNGHEIAGLTLNGSAVSACYNGQLVWPTAQMKLLWTDGVTLSGDGSSASPVGVIPSAYHRLEHCLFSGAKSVSAGTLNDAYTKYDELKILLNWSASHVDFGGYWNTIPTNDVNRELCWYLSTTATLYMNMPRIQFPNSTSFTVPYASAGMLSKSFTTTAAWGSNYNNGGKSTVIKEIWGVKYV